MEKGNSEFSIPELLEKYTPEEINTYLQSGKEGKYYIVTGF